jgi:hypothetical protein
LTKGDTKRIGEILLFVGTFWLVYTLTGKTIKIG